MRLKKLINSDFLSSADEIAEPQPDMNIKVAAFTVSEKSSYMLGPTMESYQPEAAIITLVNVYVDLVVFTHIAGTS